MSTVLIEKFLFYLFLLLTLYKSFFVLQKQFDFSKRGTNFHTKLACLITYVMSIESISVCEILFDCFRKLSWVH